MTRSQMEFVGTPPVAGLAVSGRHIGKEFVPAIVDPLRAAAQEIAAHMAVG